MKKVVGIYLIRNVVSGKCYIGSSVNIYKRWAAHKDQLRRKIHHSILLQRAWDKYGERAFTFHIMEELTPEPQRLIFVEQTYLYLFRPDYNISPTAGRVVWSESQKMDISLRMTGANNPFYGKKRPEHSRRMAGANNPFYGKSHTEDARIKSSLRKTKISKEQVVEALYLIKKGVTQKDIAKTMNICESTINRLMSGRLKAYQGIDLTGVDKKKIGNAAISGQNNKWAKLILDTQTGIYYQSIREAAIAKCVNEGTLSSYYQGKAKNKTGLIKV